MDVKTINVLREELRVLRMAAYQCALTPNSTLAKMELEDTQRNIDIILNNEEEMEKKRASNPG